MCPCSCDYKAKLDHWASKNDTNPKRIEVERDFPVAGSNLLRNEHPLVAIRNKSHTPNVKKGVPYYDWSLMPLRVMVLNATFNNISVLS
jgi:hypothetical protein